MVTLFDKVFEIDEESVFQNLKNLNFPRFVGTDREKEAAAYIENEFEKTDLDVSKQKIYYSRSVKFLTKLGFLFQAILFLLAGYFLTSRPLISAVIGAGLIAFLMVSTRWNRIISTFKGKGPKGETQNISAKTKSQGVDKKILIMAHYDTKSEFLPMRFRIIMLTLSVVGGIAYSFLIFITGLLEWVGIVNLPGSFFFYLGLFFFAVTIVLVFNKTGNVSPGIIDNASGVSVMLELARNISKNPPANSEVEFLATSAEEVGLAGARNYLKEHGDELDKDNTYVINLDVLGRGELLYNESFGIPRTRTSEDLNNLIEEVGEDLEIKVDSGYFPTGLAADHMPFVEKGFKATWLYSAMPTVHTRWDDLKDLNYDTMVNAGRIVQEMVNRIDQKF